MPGPAPLDVTDRCDRCGARAHVRTVHLSGPLYWCEHHWRQHGAALLPGQQNRRGGTVSMVR